MEFYIKRGTDVSSQPLQTVESLHLNILELFAQKQSAESEKCAARWHITQKVGPPNSRGQKRSQMWKTEPTPNSKSLPTI